MVRAEQLERALLDHDPNPAKYQVKYLINRRPKFKEFNTLNEASEFAVKVWGTNSLVFITKIKPE